MSTYTPRWRVWKKDSDERTAVEVYANNPAVAAEVWARHADASQELALGGEFELVCVRLGAMGDVTIWRVRGSMNPAYLARKERETAAAIPIAGNRDETTTHHAIPALCPFCGSAKITVHAHEWTVQSNDEPGNVAVLQENMCCNEDCGQSFWT
jgi:hypothetical protein